MHMAHSVLDRLGSSVKRLTSRIESLEYENAVLLDHLENSGILKKESLLAHVHRRRFEAQCRANPEAGQVGLADVVRNRALAATIADLAGMLEALALCQACSAPQPELTLPLRAVDGSAAAADAAAGDLGLPEVRQPPINEDDEGLGMVYIFGGNDDAKTLNSCERLNPITSVWEPLPSMRQARSAAAAAVLLNRVYVCGGNHCGQTLNHVEAYDPARQCWQNMCPLLRSRSAAGAAELFGHLYVCGGWSGKQALASVERYNPCSGTWDAVAQMQHRREWPMLTVDDGSLYMCGGQDGSEDVKAVEQYDPKTQVWEILHMSLQCRRNAAVTVVNGQLYLCGGHGHDGRRVLNSVERFDPMKGVWEALTPMQTHRRNAMAAMVAGRIYICGGRGSRGSQFQGGGHALRTAERYDPNTNTWEAMPPMALRRYRAAVVTLPM